MRYCIYIRIVLSEYHIKNIRSFVVGESELYWLEVHPLGHLCVVVLVLAQITSLLFYLHLIIGRDVLLLAVYASFTSAL